MNNSPATQIATEVTQFFTQQRDLTAQADPNLISNVEQLEREVIVIPDIITNSLLVSSTPRYFPDILAMIKKLDTVPRQVVIQALIVEVQLNNTDEFGIELGVQNPILFKRSLLPSPQFITQTNTTGQLQTTTQSILSTQGSPGFDFTNAGLPLGNNLSLGGIASLPVGGNPNIVGTQGISNYSLGRTNSELGFGGLVLSAGSDAVNVLLRALAANRKIQVLSRPQIRTLDSVLSTVFVGQNIPTVTSFNTNQTTGVISPILSPVPTGIGMEVTPRINDDGNIVIQLYANRNQLSKETVNVTTDSRGQAVGQRITDVSYVRSTVLVPSNSTIVIGGMISSRDDSFTRKAPFLGDLPVLGHLFRYDSRSSIRSEMLIFLTPRIVNGPQEEECLKEIEMGRIHFIESEAEEAHGPLRALPAADDLFEDEHVPWIKPDLPPSSAIPATPPAMQSTPRELPSPSSPTPIVPPMPTPTPSTVPPPPPLPDPNLTRINASRLRVTEADDSDDHGRVSTANWIAPSATKQPKAAQKRGFGRSK